MTKNVKVFELDQMGVAGERMHQQIIQTTQHETVPAVYIGGQFVGGFGEVDVLYTSGRLQSMIEEGASSKM